MKEIKMSTVLSSPHNYTLYFKEKSILEEIGSIYFEGGCLAAAFLKEMKRSLGDGTKSGERRSRMANLNSNLREGRIGALMFISALQFKMGCYDKRYEDLGKCDCYIRKMLDAIYRAGLTVKSRNGQEYKVVQD